MKKRNKAWLVLLALVLVTGLGAKMYSNITMGDDEWIGLGGSPVGRIVFDDQATDEVNVMNANLGVNTSAPIVDLHVRDVTGGSLGSNASTLGGIYLDNGGLTPGNGNLGNMVVFGKLGSGARASAAIAGYQSGADSDQMGLSFQVKPSSTASAPRIEAMRLDHNGNLEVVDGDITASEEIHADLQVSSGGDVLAMEDVFAYEDVIALKDVVACENVLAHDDVVAQYGSVVAAGHISTTNGSVYGTNVYASDYLHAAHVHVTDDALVEGSVFADEDVTAGGSVFIGSVEDGDEDGVHMTLRADTADGGHAVWSMSDFTGLVTIFEAASSGGEVGPDMVLHVRWLVHSDQTEAYTSGDAVLINGPHAQCAREIADDGYRNVLSVHFYEGEVLMQTVGSGGHYYDVTLVFGWVHD